MRAGARLGSAVFTDVKLEGPGTPAGCDQNAAHKCAMHKYVISANLALALPE
jgi:hypothetical protein